MNGNSKTTVEYYELKTNAKSKNTKGKILELLGISYNTTRTRR